MKLKSFAASAAAISLLAAPSVAAPRFSDVPESAWAFDTLQDLGNRYGCAFGYPDGTFQGNNNITRYEAAALLKACLDGVTATLSEADRNAAKVASDALARASAIEAAAKAESLAIGSYVGFGVNLNEQGIDGGGYSEDRVVAGATAQARFPFAKVFGNSVSIRPYLSFAAGPDSQIGAAGGVLGTYDVSLSRTNSTNLYLGAGGQWALTNNGEANYQSSIGEGSQVMFVVGLEQRLSKNLNIFADVKLPSESNDGNYRPVGTVGLGFKL